MRVARDGGKQRVAPDKAWPLIKRFWPWVRPHMGYVWITVALLIVSTPLPMISPLIVRRVVDDAVSNSDRSEILFWGMVLVGMTLLSVLFALAIGYCTTLFHTKVIREIRLKMYFHMQRLSYRFYSEKEAGYLMSRQTDDINNLSGVMADSFATAAVDAVRGVGYLVMIFYVEWRMALGGLVLVLLIFGYQYAISGKMRELSRLNRELWTEVSAALHQGISGYPLVQATASERHEGRRFAEVLHRSVRAGLRQDMFFLITRNVFRLIGGVAPTIIVLAGVYLIVTSDLTVGGLFAFFMYLMQMFSAASTVANVNPRMQSSLASLERIYEILDTEPEVTSPEDGVRLPELRGEVRFENVSFAYDPDVPVLRDISLAVPPRTMVALVGPSGAGKTTLAHLLPRFFDPVEGRVLIDGHELRSLDLHWYRRHIGLVPQEIFLFDRSVAENITYGTIGATEEQVREAAAAANALEFIEQMPKGFETLIGERGVRLSGGQRQRLAIAREILRDPAILVLDEATSSLDSETEALIQEALGVLLSGRTSFVIAHRLSTVVRADVIVALQDGRIAELGRHDELLARGGLYARLYHSQFREPAPAAT
jgi:subfamily B ATP-binding cassette protein MsbA